MRIFAPFALCMAGIVAADASAEARQRSPFEAGHRLFEGAFDPRRNFAGDIRPSTTDEMILTIAVSSRDDYAPAYSLALAYLCPSTGGQCRYVARLLRVPPSRADEEELYGSGLGIMNRIAAGQPALDVLEASELDWLEADAAACGGVIAALDAVRQADWRPDLPWSLTREGTGDLILHPAQIRIEWYGAYARARYRGWIMAAGVPDAARTLMERLEPCWRPTETRRPWERTAPRRRSPLP